MKKVLCVAASLLLMLTFTLTFAAAPSANVAGLPEEYRDLYEIIPMGAYGGETITFDNLPYTDLATNYHMILINKLVKDGVIVRPEKEDVSYDPKDNLNAPKIPLETVKKSFEELFGKGSFDKLDSTERFTNKTDNLIYDAASNSYVYTCYNWGGGDPAVSVYSKYVKAESSQGEVCIYEIFAMYGDYQGKCLFADAGRLAEKEGILLWKGTDGSSLWAKLGAGELDEYLPVYKHTFKDNGQGGYYWYSTEIVEVGTPFPDGLISDVPVSDSSAGDSTEGEHTILGGNWGSTVQPSTDTQQPPEPSDDSAPLWGVILGWGFVGAALIVGAVLLLKRYKK